VPGGLPEHTRAALDRVRYPHGLTPETKTVVVQCARPPLDGFAEQPLLWEVRPIFPPFWVIVSAVRLDPARCSGPGLFHFTPTGSDGPDDSGRLVCGSCRLGRVSRDSGGEAAPDRPLFAVSGPAASRPHPPPVLLPRLRYRVLVVNSS